MEFSMLGKTMYSPALRCLVYDRYTQVVLNVTPMFRKVGGGDALCVKANVHKGDALRA